jgi:hypothetical protein
MNKSAHAVSRRSVLVSGVAASVLATPLVAVAGSPSSTWVLSGRLTDRHGQPMRQAQVTVSGTAARTDGDGRFFMQTTLPAQTKVALQVRLAGQAQEVEMWAPFERHPFTAQPHASMALTIAV